MGENNCRASCIVIHPCCREDNASSERERAVSLLASSFGGDPGSGAAGAKIDLSSSGIVISDPVVWLGWRSVVRACIAHSCCAAQCGDAPRERGGNLKPAKTFHFRKCRV